MSWTLCAALVLAGTTTTNSCAVIVGPVCKHEVRWPALSVEVTDSITSAPLASGARVIASDGAFADTAIGEGSDSARSLALDRAGTYTVTVDREGYAPWSRHGVHVTGDDCHVHTVKIFARLQRSGGEGAAPPVSVGR